LARIVLGAQHRTLGDESIRVGRLLLVLALARLVFRDDGVGEHAAIDVNQAPFFFSRHRVEVALAQKSNIVGVFEFFDGGWITAHFAHENLDGALVLFAAFDQQLFLGALGLEGYARNFVVERDGNHGRHEEDQQHGIAGLAGGVGLSHPAASSASGRVCSCLNCVSSITTEFTPMRTTR
jgi:hypothetical protein